MSSLVPAAGSWAAAALLLTRSPRPRPAPAPCHRYSEQQKPRVLVSLAAVGLFMAVGWPLIVYYTGWAGLVKFWLMPWLGYHFWMSEWPGGARPGGRGRPCAEQQGTHIRHPCVCSIVACTAVQWPQVELRPLALGALGCRQSLPAAAHMPVSRCLVGCRHLHRGAPHRAAHPLQACWRVERGQGTTVGHRALRLPAGAHLLHS